MSDVLLGKNAAQELAAEDRMLGCATFKGRSGPFEFLTGGFLSKFCMYSSDCGRIFGSKPP